MGRQNRFDEAIKAKMEDLQDEPSARVWAGVRTEVGTIMPPHATFAPWRMAAAVTLLCVAGLSTYLLWPRDAQQRSGEALTSKVKRIVIDPLDRAGVKGNYLANGATIGQPSPIPAPQRRDHGMAIVPQPIARPQDSLKNLPPMPQMENPRIEVVHNDGPTQLDSPAPKTPERKTPDLQGLEDPTVRTAPAIASAGSKRSYKVPGRDELSSENLKRKSGAILGAITNGANTFLGLNANYEEHHQDDLKLTAFNADFGLFKIKKVRTVKN